LLAYYTENIRLFFIAALFSITLPFLELLDFYLETDLNILIAFGLPGAIILAMGSIYLHRFMIDNKLPALEVVDGL
jgi:hypothetical protein